MLRSARDLTQKEVADRAGIQRVTYTRAETNKRSPHRLTVEVLAEALDVPEEALLDDQACLQAVAQILGTTAPTAVARSEGPLVDEARRLAAQLPADRQAAVASVLRGLVQLQVPASPVPVPSRSAVADEGRRGGRKKDDKSSA